MRIRLKMKIRVFALHCIFVINYFNQAFICNISNIVNSISDHPQNIESLCIRRLTQS